jgi:hypothetical protein
MATQSEAQTGDIKKFIDAFNAELEKVYTKATTDLGPWKKAREEAIKITKLRTGTWPVDPAVKTIGDLFAYVFFDPDGVKYKTPPYFIISNGLNAYVDEALKQQYGDWIDDMNGVSVSDPSIGVIFKSLAWPYKNNNWTGDDRKSTNPISLSDSARIIQNFNEIKKPGITNPDKYSAGQWWFDLFMSQVIGLNGSSGYLKSKKYVDPDTSEVTWGSNNSKIEEVFPEKFLENNKKVEKSFSYYNYGTNNAKTAVYDDKDVYTISVSKFVKGETVPFPIIPYQYDRRNYTDYGAERTAGNKGYGFAKILEEIDGGVYAGFDIRDFEGLKTQYRPGVNSLESLSKDPLFNPWRTIRRVKGESAIIEWEGTGTQSQETGIYWDYFIEPGKTASVVGKYEDILLYNAFLEAGDDYKTITIPKYAPEPKVEPPVVSTLVPTTESKLSGEFTFNVEKKDTFVVVGNQNFALKIGDLVIEGLTTSSVIESPKTIDLGDGIIIVDDGESDEDIYFETPFGVTEEEQDALRAVYGLIDISSIDMNESIKEKAIKTKVNDVDDVVTTAQLKNASSEQDFWTLVAICSREDGDEQAWCDVAQSIYNRVGSGKYSGKNITSIVTAKWQYEPCWSFPSHSGENGVVNAVWKKIVDINSASVASKQPVDHLKKVAKALKNKTLQNNSKSFIKGRTDFLGVGQAAKAMTNNGSKIQRTSRNNQFGYSFNYTATVCYSTPNIVENISVA